MRDKVTNIDVFNDFVSHTNEHRVRSSEVHDKAVLTLSATALAFTLTFLKDFIKAGEVVSPVLLVWVWGLFCLSMVSIILSYSFGQIGLGKNVKLKKKFLIEGLKEFENKKSGWAWAANILTYLSSVTCVAGLILTVIFASLNL